MTSVVVLMYCTFLHGDLVIARSSRIRLPVCLLARLRPSHPCRCFLLPTACLPLIVRFFFWLCVCRLDWLVVRQVQADALLPVRLLLFCQLSTLGLRMARSTIADFMESDFWLQRCSGFIDPAVSQLFGSPLSGSYYLCRSVD